MELRRYLHLIRRRLLLVLVTTLVGALAGYGATSHTTKYRTTSVLYVGALDLSTNPAQLYLENQLNQIVATFASMIPSPVIAEKAVLLTGVNRNVGTVVSETKATVVTGTNLIDITVTDPSPLVAQELTNGLSEAFVQQVKSYPSSSASSSASSSSSGAANSSTGQGAVPSVPAYVFQAAALGAAVSNGLVRKVVLGAVFGLVGSILLVLLLDYVDLTVRSPAEIERRLGLPTLGIVPVVRHPEEAVPVA